MKKLMTLRGCMSPCNWMELWSVYRDTANSSCQPISTVTLTIHSNVRGDRVYIDGKYKGSTRLDLNIPKGRYTIRIEKEGYETYEEKIYLKNALTLRASLEIKILQCIVLDHRVARTGPNKAHGVEDWSRFIVD